VFVGGNGTSLSDLREAISSHYHTQVPIYFLSDSTGNWMVVDTTGFPYAGGLATLTGPVLDDPSHKWSFESSPWVAEVDATGSTEGTSLLPF
jgi:hypothetical protein